MLWDTADGCIGERHGALELVRVDEGPWIERVYARDGGGEWRIEHQSVLRDSRPDAATAKRLSGADDLRPVVERRASRSIRSVRHGDRTEIAFAVDRGEWRPRPTRTAWHSFSELELALMRGEEGRLFELASTLLERIPELRLISASAIIRGLEQMDGMRPRAPRIAPSLPEREDSAARIVHRGLAQCLAQITSNAGPARRNDDEALHRLRVGIRRFRTACTVAPKAGLASMPASVRADVRWLWDELGAARDADVFVTRTWPSVVKAGDARGVASFEPKASALHARRRAKLRRVLDGPRFQRLVLAMHRYVRAQRAVADGSEGGDARAIASRLLARNAGKARRRSEDVLHLSNARLHRLRIATKRLRYLGEFFAPLFDGKASRKYLALLVALQRDLGDLNDLSVGARLVETIASSSGPVSRTAGALTLYRRYRDAREEGLRRDVAKRVRKLRRSDPFWRS